MFKIPYIHEKYLVSEVSFLPVECKIRASQDYLALVAQNAFAALSTLIANKMHSLNNINQNKNSLIKLIV